MRTSKSVLITGATRGLGANLVRQFAARGYRLALTGRDREALQRLATEVEEQAQALIIETLDVEDSDAIAQVIKRCASQLNGLDIVIVNAGVAFSTPAGKGHLEQIHKTIDINLTAAIVTSEAAVELFRQQGGGQLVGITSLAGIRGMRGQGAYSASKAGFSRYLQSLRCETLREPIVVTELAPGYIDTDLNKAVANRPFLVSAEKGTQIMADLIERQVGFRYVPPWPWTLVAQALKWLPNSVIAKM